MAAAEGCKWKSKNPNKQTSKIYLKIAFGRGGLSRRKEIAMKRE